MMKKNIYILFALAMLITISSCKKTGSGVNPLSNYKNLAVGAYLTLDSTLNVNFNSTALATSTVGIEATQFPDGQAIQSIVLFVSTSTSIDTANWSKIKTIPYTGPKTKITATGQEMATALHEPLDYFQPGTNYTFFTRVITKSGQTFDSSNTGNDAGTGFLTGSTYHAAFTFTAFIVCPFIGPVAGTYTVKRDDWVDWNPGDLVHVSDAGANQINLSQVYPGGPDGGISTGKLIVNIDPATGTAYVPTEDIGNYGGGAEFSVTGFGGAVDPKLGTQCGYVFSCTGYIGVTLDFTSSAGDYGPQTLILQLKQLDSQGGTGLIKNDVIKSRKKF